MVRRPKHPVQCAFWDDRRAARPIENLTRSLVTKTTFVASGPAASSRQIVITSAILPPTSHQAFAAIRNCASLAFLFFASSAPMVPRLSLCRVVEIQSHALSKPNAAPSETSSAYGRIFPRASPGKQPGFLSLNYKDVFGGAGGIRTPVQHTFSSSFRVQICRTHTTICTNCGDEHPALA